MPKISFSHLSSAADLVTPYENTRAAFLEMALEKNNRATPFVAEARDLQAQLAGIRTPDNLLGIESIRGALLTAAGISDKAFGHIGDEGKENAVFNLIERHLKPAGAGFREELVYRFLLTRGDSLGGSMRNAIGSLAQRRLSLAIISRFANANVNYDIRIGNKYIQSKNIDVNIKQNAEQIKEILWSNKKGDRILLYNKKVSFVGNNVDLCLLSSKSTEIPSNYLCLGELKGGFDPAGADEHWKTARSALLRIATSFEKERVDVNLCFIGAAVEASMANEIWEMLQERQLTFAANLTIDKHLSEFVSWLTTL
jgi:hypothetical protein